MKGVWDKRDSQNGVQKLLMFLESHRQLQLFISAAGQVAWLSAKCLVLGELVKCSNPHWCIFIRIGIRLSALCRIFIWTIDQALRPKLFKIYPDSAEALAKNLPHFYPDMDQALEGVSGGPVMRGHGARKVY